MNVVIASTFRDAVPYIDRYLAQCSALLEVAEMRGDKVRFVWGENDSVDDTADRLANAEGDTTIVDCSTGAPYYQSAEVHSMRWANVASYCNATLDALPDDLDVLVWVESDLIWDPEMLLALADQAPLLGTVAAPVWRGSLHYDSYTTRKDGERFTPPQNAGLVRVDSCAGCIAMNAETVKRARFSSDDCASFTRDVGGVWLDTNLKVEHPR